MSGNSDQRNERSEILGKLKARNFSFEKKFGQNFLTDVNLLRAIATDSGCAGGAVLEIGCGAGTLTRELAKTASEVWGFEIDRRLEPVLSETLAEFDNVRIEYSDFLNKDMSELEEEIGEDYRVVANLPYYITTPILLKILEQAKRARSLTLMVQEEVADRLTAEAGSPEYGAVTVAVNLIGSARIDRKVSRNLFTPPPNVDSAVVTVTVDEAKRAQFADVYLRKLARSAFAMRRKTLSNNISAAFGLPREKIVSALRACGFAEAVRGERLSAEDFVRLAEELRKN